MENKRHKRTGIERLMGWMEQRMLNPTERPHWETSLGRVIGLKKDSCVPTFYERDCYPEEIATNIPQTQWRDSYSDDRYKLVSPPHSVSVFSFRNVKTN